VRSWPDAVSSGESGGKGDGSGIQDAEFFISALYPYRILLPEVYNSASDGTVNCGLNVMEMTMPQQYIDFAFVEANASFDTVLAHYNLQAIGAGKDRAVLCPFHEERKPSCKIELERKIFHCFGCGTKGNVLEFVARIEGNPEDLRAAAFTLVLQPGFKW